MDDTGAASNTECSGNLKASDDVIEQLQGVDGVDQTKKVPEKRDNESNSDDSDFDVAFTCTLCNRSFSGYKAFMQHEKGAKHHKALLKKKSVKKLNQKLENDLSGTSSNEESFLGQEPFAICKTCDKDFWGPESFQQHLDGKRHRKKMATAKIMEQITDDGTINIEKLMELRKQERGFRNVISEAGAVALSPADDDEDNDMENRSKHHQFECTDCEKVFSGVESWYQHLVSKVHEKKVQQKKMMEEVTSGGPSQKSKVSSGFYDSIQLDEDVLVCKMCHMSFSGTENASAHLKSRGHKKKIENKAWKMSNTIILNPKERSKRDSQASEAVNRNQTPESKSINEKQEILEVKSGNSALDSSSKPLESVAIEKSEDEFASVNQIVMPNAPPALEISASSKENDVKNTLLCYKVYKEYKQVMNKIQSEKE